MEEALLASMNPLIRFGPCFVSSPTVTCVQFDRTIGVMASSSVDGLITIYSLPRDLDGKTQHSCDGFTFNLRCTVFSKLHADDTISYADRCIVGGSVDVTISPAYRLRAHIAPVLSLHFNEEKLIATSIDHVTYPLHWIAVFTDFEL